MPQKLPNLITSTAGAVPVYNDKGELTMQKVKVTRYVSGRRPEYAESGSDSESSDDEVELPALADEEYEPVVVESVDDRRLQRLRERQAEHIRERRAVPDPEVVYEAKQESSEDEEDPSDRLAMHRMMVQSSSSESSDEELDEEALEKRRELMRERARQRELEEDVLAVAEEAASEAGSEESSEYEEYTDSEDETAGPRLKPVFVKKSERVTITDQSELDKQTEILEKQKQRETELRKKESHRLVEAAVKEELAVEQGAAVEAVVVTDDENDEMEYEAWKLRELKRIKRDREEREQMEKEQEEVERLRNMTEEERIVALKNRPKTITNQMSKGKYKFLQKYYHRGAFYLDEEQDVFKRDIAEPTLEDHFDKTILPKVMQVKNFGRAGRTKYTHLVDQDTSEMESGWNQITAINLKFQNQGGGTKQNFEKPSLKKRKLN